MSGMCLESTVVQATLDCEGSEGDLEGIVVTEAELVDVPSVQTGGSGEALKLQEMLHYVNESELNGNLFFRNDASSFSEEAVRK